MSIPLQKRIVYGPVHSRRLGSSLGVNLLPPDLKVCNMNCAYCQYGWTRERAATRTSPIRWPAPARIEAAVSARLKRAAAAGELIDRITVAGHGEPTLHPEFEEIAERLGRVRDQVAPRLRLAILSNSTTASWPDVRRGLAYFEERHMKLDAGDPITYARINGPGPSVEHIVDALRALPGIVIQSMFVTDAAHQIDNTTPGAIAEWLDALERVNATRVHVYTIDRAPALDALRPVSARRLREIAEHVRAAAIPCDVFAASASGRRRREVA